MGAKESISNGHMSGLKRAHAGKPILPAEERTAVVVGSDLVGNIGRHIAVRLKADGFGKVYEPPMEVLDVTRAAMCREYFQDHAHADTLVLSHGVVTMNWFEDDAMAGEIIITNLVGAHRAAQAFVRATLTSGVHKHIIMIGSMAYCNVLNASASYCASKAGLAMLARCLAWELAPKGYTVVAVHPSNTEGTPMTEATIQGIMRVRGVDRETAEDYWGAVLPKEEWLQPEDIADLVSYVALGGAGGYLAGANLELRGGQR